MLTRFFTRNSDDSLSTVSTPGRSMGEAVYAPAKKAESPAQVKIPTAPAIAVLGAKGGAGATTIALNLAVAFAQRHLKTTLIDANLQQPIVAHALGKVPQHSLEALLESKSHVDEQLFLACSLPVAANLSLNFLSPPLDGSQGVKSNLSEVAHTLTQIREYANLWLLDLPSHLDRHLVTIADSCTKIILVFEATVAGVATCRRWLEVFQELGYDNDRILCVLNRAGSKLKAVEDQIDAVFVGRKLVRIPNATQLLWQSATEGVPAVLLQPNHAYTRSIIKLAETIAQAINQE